MGTIWKFLRLEFCKNRSQEVEEKTELTEPTELTELSDQIALT